MAIAYESKNSSTNSNSCDVPSGTQAGDLLVAIVSNTANNTVPSTTGPSGWEEIVNGVNFGGATESRHWVGYIFVTGSPPSSYTWGNLSNSNRHIVIQRFSGVASYGGDDWQGNGNTSTNTAPTITPDTNGSLIFWWGAGFHSGSPATPSGYGNADSSFSSGRTDHLICSRVQATAAATGAIASTGWGTFFGQDQHAGQIWFRPIVEETTNRRRRLIICGAR